MEPIQNDGFSFIAGIIWQLSERKEDEPIGGMRPHWNSVRQRWAATGAEESEFTAGHVVQNDSERLFLGSSRLVPGRAAKEIIGCRHREGMVLPPLGSPMCGWLSKGIEHISCRIHVCNLQTKRNIFPDIHLS
jgi:hypothetical protein